jgi:hypothetical protein
MDGVGSQSHKKNSKKKKKIGGRPTWPGYFTAVGFIIYNCSTVGYSIRNFKDLASVLGLLSFAFTVRDLEVSQLTVLNKPVIIKLTEREETLEGNLIESRTEEGNFPT